MIRFTIFGEPASKSNSRIPRVVTSKKTGKPYTMFIKSMKANHYERDALMQIPSDARQMLEGPVRVTLRIFYASERPDLDESVVLDVMQARYSKRDASGNRDCIRRGCYANDRQVREKHVYHFIDRANPRAEIEIEAMAHQPAPLPDVAEPLAAKPF